MSIILIIMPRVARKAPGGIVYHVLNRSNGNAKLFKSEEDFLAFEKVLLAAWKRVAVRILCWCVMPDHWHLVIWPKRDGELTTFMRWLTLTHTQRWKQAHRAVGKGHLYQGRFKSFPIEEGEHLQTVVRFVESNPLRSKLVRKVEHWRWGSLVVWQARSHDLRPLLSQWPIRRPPRWAKLVNASQNDAEVRQLKEHIRRNRPLGSERWMREIAKALNLEQSLRPRGRPKGGRKPHVARRKRAP